MAITFFVVPPKILLGMAVSIRHHPHVPILWLPQFGYEQNCSTTHVTSDLLPTGAWLWLEMAVQDTHRPETTRLTQRTKSVKLIDMLSIPSFAYTHFYLPPLKPALFYRTDNRCSPESVF